MKAVLYCVSRLPIKTQASAICLPDYLQLPKQYYLGLPKSDTICRNAVYYLAKMRLVLALMKSETDFSISQSDTDMTRYK